MCIRDSIENLQWRMNNPGAIKGISSGYRRLDLTLEASGDGDSWAEVPGFSLAPTAGEEAGALANGIAGRAPYGMGRYIRLKAVADAASGDNTAAKCELSIRV